MFSNLKNTEFCIILSSQCVIDNWDQIQIDYKDVIKSPYEFIYKSKKGEITFEDIKIIVQDKLPEFK